MSITPPSMAQKIVAQRNAKILRATPMLLLAISTEYSIQGMDNMMPNYFDGAFLIPLGPELARAGLADLTNHNSRSHISERVHSAFGDLAAQHKKTPFFNLSLEFLTHESSGFEGLIARISAPACVIPPGRKLSELILGHWRAKLAAPLAAMLAAAPSDGFVCDEDPREGIFPISTLWSQPASDSLRALAESQALSSIPPAPSAKAGSRGSL